MAHNQRVYSDNFIAGALAAVAENKGNVSGTAKRLGVPCSTLRNWVKLGKRANPDLTTSAQEKKESLIDLWTDLFHEVIETIGQGDLKGLTTFQKITVLAIATEKIKLLGGASDGGDEPLDRLLRQLGSAPAKPYQPPAVA